MLQNRQVYCFIPARGGSKGVKNKNKLLISKKPLVEHSIESAKKIKHIDKIFVSTDDNQIKKIALKNDAIVIDRKKELSKDSTNILNVFKHMIDKIKVKDFIVVIFFPTAPIRDIKKISNAFRLYDDNTDCVISVVKSKIRPAWLFVEENGSLKFWKKGKPESNRQQQKENYYYLTGTAIITSSEFLRKQKHVFIGGKIKGFIVDEINGIDIDTKLDFKICKLLMEQL
tara:strand:- start:88 stop:771 length:684 start_codon:yes stop_codon:yes gene_type:complete